MEIGSGIGGGGARGVVGTSILDSSKWKSRFRIEMLASRGRLLSRRMN